MALNIKSKEAHELAAKLAKLTGKSMTADAGMIIDTSAVLAVLDLPPLPQTPAATAPQ